MNTIITKFLFGAALFVTMYGVLGDECFFQVLQMYIIITINTLYQLYSLGEIFTYYIHVYILRTLTVMKRPCFISLSNKPSSFSVIFNFSASSRMDCKLIQCHIQCIVHVHIHVHCTSSLLMVDWTTAKQIPFLQVHIIFASCFHVNP